VAKHSPLPIARRAWKAAVLAAVAFGVAVLAGCDLGAEPDIERGRALFAQHCGACHTLAEAGTAATIAPNLDATFADARASGMGNDTIAGVTRDQIANPRAIREDDPLRDRVFMPADLVTGQDAKDVAAYVGSVAGVPDIAPPELTAEQLFVDSCGGCHTLEAAGTVADTGPDLDEVLPGQEPERVREAIVDPMAIVTPGFEPGIMPSFEDTLTDEELDELVQYLLDSVENGGQDGG
jgi:mono/diheme cytochrome c family protein